MEGLRSSLLVPSGATFFMIIGCAHAMKEMIGVRYAAKDDDGKTLLPHPYEPWAKVPEKYQKKADDAYRAFKMFENVKEWTFLALPLMWTSFLYSGGLPFMTEDRVDALIGVTSLAYSYGTAKFISGYVKSPEDRIYGFKIRRKATESWILISLVSIGYAALERAGFVGKK